MKILVVEDEKIHRITLADLLGKEGHAVTACADGDDACAQVPDRCLRCGADRSSPARVAAVWMCSARSAHEHRRRSSS